MSNVSLGSYIKEKRLEKGYSLKDLEEKSKVISSYIDRIENGFRKTPSVPVLEKLGEALDIEKKELIKLLSKTK